MTIGYRITVIAMVAAGALLALRPMAWADPVTLTGSYLQVGISDYGTFGSDGSTEPGLLHDPTGKGSFSPGGVSNDYLTPGTPHDGFAINSGQTGLIINDNDGSQAFGFTSPTLLTGAAAKGFDNAATWTSTYGSALTVTNTYFFNKGDEQVRITSTITALANLSNVAFGRSEDPDPDVNQYGSFDTVNTRGDKTTAPQDLVSAAGQYTGLTIGILNESGATYPHNTEISTDCCSNDDPYNVLASASTLAYPGSNSGDYGLQIAWSLGDLAAGQSREVDYAYVFGTHQDSVSSSSPSSLAIDTTDGDLAPNVFSLGSPAAQAATVEFNGGVLRMTGGLFPGNVIGAPVTIDATNGTVDTSTGNGGFSGVVSGPGSLTIVGGGTFSLTGANSYAGGTVLDASTVAVGADAALGTGTLTFNGGTLLAAVDGLTLANAATLAGNGAIDTQAFALGYAGAIAGTGNLTKRGTGTLTLSGANTFTGSTTVEAGTLKAGAPNALSPSSALTVAGGATLDLNAFSQTVGSLAGSGTVRNDGAAAATLSAGGNNASTTFAGTLADGKAALALVKTGSGTLTLTQADGYSGGTELQGGTLGVADKAALGTGALTFAGGTLQAAADRLAIGNAAVLASDGTIDTQGYALVYAGTIAGPGQLSKVGSGTLVLPGANSYAGGTVLNAGTVTIGDRASLGTGSLTFAGGTLQAGVDGLTLGAAATIASSGAIDTQGFGLTYGGAIGGPGSLAKLGSGTLTLTADNSYAGGTLIAGGTLQVGAGGTSGSLAGDVVDNGTLAFERSDDLTFGGSITGSGVLRKAGAGTLTLSGANSYAGGTQLLAGTLAIGDDDALGSGSLSMDEGTTLRFTADGLTLANAIRLTGTADPTIDTGSGTQTMAGPISGSGALTKIGSGTLVLTADNTYSGATSVAAGTLEVDGSVGNSTVTVAGGAALGGGGTVGALVTQSGATVAPAAGRTLTVLGNVTFAAGSTDQVTVNGDGSSNRLSVGGSAALGGARLSVLAGTGPFTVSKTYTLLTAPGGVSGTFGTIDVASALALFAPSVSYTADDVLLNLRLRDFAALAATPNEAAVARALQGLGPNSALYNAVLLQDQAGARQAFAASSGIAQASSTTVVRSTSQILTGLVLDRLWDVGGSGLSARQVLDQFSTDRLPALVRCYGPVPDPVPMTPASYTAWGEGFGSFGHSDGGLNAGGLDRSLGGFVLGVDTPLSGPLDAWRAGAAGGYTNTSFTSHVDGGSGTVQGVFGSLYGGARYGAVDIRLGTTVSGTSTDTVRRVAFPGFLESDRASYGGLAAQGFGEIGYRFAFARAVLEPVAGAAILHVHQDGFDEHGGAAALIGSPQDNDLGTTTLGVRGEVAPLTGVPMVAHAFLGWQHTIGNVTPVSTLAFASAGSNPFTVSGTPIDRDALAAEVALDYRTSAVLDIGLSYTGLVGATASENAVKGRMEYRF